MRLVIDALLQSQTTRVQQMWMQQRRGVTTERSLKRLRKGLFGSLSDYNIDKILAVDNTDSKQLPLYCVQMIFCAFIKSTVHNITRKHCIYKLHAMHRTISNL